MTVKYRPVNSVIMVREVTLVLALLFICTGAHPSAAPCPTQQACPNITTCAPYVPVTSPLATLPAPPAPPVLGLLKVKGDSSTCRGMVYLGLNGSYGLPLCSDSAQRVPRGTLCRQLGCGGYHQQSETQRHIEGYYIHGNGSLETSTCRALEIHCKAPGDSRELKVYKVVTWLLLGLFLFFLLVRIAPHMYSFICKRYRSSTWIGPAQSQSVSFYRVQAGVPPNNSTSKRTSYPGEYSKCTNSYGEDTLNVAKPASLN